MDTSSSSKSAGDESVDALAEWSFAGDARFTSVKADAAAVECRKVLRFIGLGFLFS
jgi:hypothetical protein